MIKTILALVNVLPRILDAFDAVIGAITRWQDKKRRDKVNKRDRERNELTRELKRETDEKKRRDILRRLNRHG